MSERSCALSVAMLKRPLRNQSPPIQSTAKPATAAMPMRIFFRVPFAGLAAGAAGGAPASAGATWGASDWGEPGSILTVLSAILRFLWWERL